MLVHVLRSLALVILVGCASQAQDWTEVVEVGQVGYDGMTPLVHVPQSSTAGSDFVVDVTTWGGGCQSLESTEVVASSGVIDVTPYDRRRIPPPGSGCTQPLLVFEHHATIVFDMPGMQTIRLHVRSPDVHGVLQALDLSYQVGVQ